MSEKDNKKRRRLTLRPGAIVYAVLFVYALVLTQLLRNPVSAVFFWFLLIVLPISVILTVIGRACISVYVFTDRTYAEKNSPVEYEIRIINNSPLPIPFVEAIMTKPGDEGVRSVRQRLVLSMVPFSGYSVKTNVAFRYRGLFEIGVEEFYVTDPLHIFRIRTDVNNYSNVTVSPRMAEMDSPFDSAVTDMPTSAVKVTDAREMAEMANIREYRMGDTLKSIHWKLSSKTEELQVKDYNINNDKHTYFLVDLSAPTFRVEEEIMAEKVMEEKKKRRISIKKPSDIVEFFREKRRKRNYIRRRVKGESAADIRAAELIDSFIKETINQNKKKKKPDAKEAAMGADTPSATATERLDAIISAADGEKRDGYDAEGGAVLARYADEMPEFCADGVVEITLSALAHEIRTGSRCTVIWYDSREDNGICTVEAVSPSDVELLLSSFSTAPVDKIGAPVSRLAEFCPKSSNTTVKIVTANLNADAVTDFCDIPRIFGGSGTGCSAEILLFDPDERFAKPSHRREYVYSCYTLFKQSGIELLNIKERPGNDGKPHLYDCIRNY